MKNVIRVLLVTPEISTLPRRMGNMANYLNAKGGGLAEVSTTLTGALFKIGVDVHIAVPHFRKLFNVDTGNFVNKELFTYKCKGTGDRIHLAEDRSFYYQNRVYDFCAEDNVRIALRFQREVINNIIPRVRPDIIHCNDWMTGLIPAMAKRLNIPCLFTFHNIHTVKRTICEIEEQGIDAAEFWQNLYFDRLPRDYYETRESNPVDFLTSGIFAADFINTVSPTFMKEVVDGHHNSIGGAIRREIVNKFESSRGIGILNAPDPAYSPSTDRNLIQNYDASNHTFGKLANKRYLQNILGLEGSDRAPLFFWPSRLDPVQKGCQIFSDILYHIVSKYWQDQLQIVMIAGGPYEHVFNDIIRMHNFKHRVALRTFDRNLACLAYGASDFVLLPSLYEPCGLPQMVGQKYGVLPIVRDTGGLHDTVRHLNVTNDCGNGFVFNDYDANGLIWAIDQSMQFYRCSKNVKERTISRIMDASKRHFDDRVMAQTYKNVYDSMLQQKMFPVHDFSITQITDDINEVHQTISPAFEFIDVFNNRYLSS